MRHLVLATMLIVGLAPRGSAQELERVGQEKDAGTAQNAPANRAINPEEIMRTFQTIQVQTGTWLAKPEMCEGALQKRKEFDKWGLFFLRNRSADVFLKIDHQPGWFYYQYSFEHARSGLVLASGNVTAWDGPAACGKVADILVEKLKKVRSTGEDGEKNKKEKEKGKDKPQEKDKEKDSRKDEPRGSAGRGGCS